MRMVVNIDVPELAPAVAFYSAALGLRHSRTLDDDVAELTGGASVIYLLRCPAGSPASPSGGDLRRYDRHWTPVHIDFVVENIEAATRRALDAGARREGDCVAWRGAKVVTLSDPFGHGFCLVEFAEQTYEGD